jgi:23S rRNA pseudouridine1911/1915/1917 synthase
MGESAKNAADYNPSPASPTPVRVVVPAECAGLRLDQCLARLMPEYSRNRLQAWVRDGHVVVDGKAATPRDRVWGGEHLDVTPLLDPKDLAQRPEPIPLAVVHEDDTLMVIDKPAGLVVHPGSGNWQGTLLNALLYHAPQLAALPRAGIVHRLDKETSGLMVVAKTLEAQVSLTRQIQARSVRRDYLALVLGHVGEPGRVEAPVGRHPVQRTRMAVVPSGKPAVTYYEAVERLPGCTLVRCRLETGRTHQIRVHMQSIGHPLVGDTVYGRRSSGGPPAVRELLTGFPRQALHAVRLELVHPRTGSRVNWECSLPPDMERLVRKLRAAQTSS